MTPKAKTTVREQRERCSIMTGQIAILRRELDYFANKVKELKYPLSIRAREGILRSLAILRGLIETLTAFMLTFETQANSPEQLDNQTLAADNPP